MKFLTTAAAVAVLQLLAATARADGVAAPDAPAAPAAPAAAGAAHVEIVGTSAYPEAPGYLAPSADSTTRSATPIKDQAAAIQVVPAAVLRDRGVTRTDQLVENVSGVLPESSYGGNGATFFNIRGFSENNGLRDGFRNFGYFAYRDVQDIERVEVFKGPAGALYGGIGAVGGYVNTVSKRPAGDDFAEAGLLAGSYGLARSTLDANKSLGGGLRARLNLSAETDGGFRDDSGHDAWAVAPALAWSDGAGTAITLLTEFDHLRRDGFDLGIPDVPDYRALSRTRYFGVRDGEYPGLAGDYGRNDTQAVTLLLDRVLDPVWTLHVGANYNHARQLSNQTFPNSTTPDGDLLDYTVYSGVDESSAQYALRAEVAGTLALGGRRHAVLAGVDYGYLEQGGDGSSGHQITFDLLDAAYRSSVTDVGSFASHQGQGKDFGIYVQDQVDLAPGVKAFAALRADRFDNRALVSGAVTGTNAQTAFSPRVGLVWQPAARTSLFADWSRSHAPNVGHAANENTFAAEVAQQVEGGVKQQFLDQRLLATLSVFRLDRSNILTADPQNPLLEVLTGRESSSGVEADVSGALAADWRLIASYSYIDAQVRRDTSIPVGDRLSNVPRHHASLWTTHDIAAVPGLDVGGGVYYVGARQASLPNTFMLPAYVRTDAALTYRRDAWRLQMNVTNLFNRVYYTGGSAGTFDYTLDPSPPRELSVSASYRF